MDQLNARVHAAGALPMSGGETAPGRATARLTLKIDRRTPVSVGDTVRMVWLDPLIIGELRVVGFTRGDDMLNVVAEPLPGCLVDFTALSR